MSFLYYLVLKERVKQLKKLKFLAPSAAITSTHQPAAIFEFPSSRREKFGSLCEYNETVYLIVPLKI